MLRYRRVSTLPATNAGPADSSGSALPVFYTRRVRVTKLAEDALRTWEDEGGSLAAPTGVGDFLP